MRNIELLAPARDMNCGIEAILHGADAVYIGGPSFSARAAAGNSIEDIAHLCRFAHTYHARIYVTLNTILHDEELSEAEQMIHRLYDAGVDALIIQDYGLLGLNLPPIPLHASTQMDNRTPEQAKRLESLGFSQIVLARELGLKEISGIHAATRLPLEVFVHGALCVSYSGKCYASEYLFHRSANRGRCAQFCRLAFDLIDGTNHTRMRQCHCLSLRDMNRSASLEEMMDAGVSSFKIEGRLKDVAYVKNVTAYYRRELDRILSRRANDYRRSSSGKVSLAFTPKLEKSFNRGFTEYFLHRQDEEMHSFHTPKSLGERIGVVTHSQKHAFDFSPLPDITIVPGDGLCYYDDLEELRGFSVNAVNGNTITPASGEMPRKGTILYRNHDLRFFNALSRTTASRRIAVSFKLSESQHGIRLDACDEDGMACGEELQMEHQKARTPQTDAIRRTLCKTGDTPYEVINIDLFIESGLFIPASLLATLRRRVIGQLTQKRLDNMPRDKRRTCIPDVAPALPQSLDFTANVANKEALRILQQMGTEKVEPALEIRVPQHPVVLMTCRHCLRRALGACLQKNGAKEIAEPLTLRLSDGRCFPLKFDCKNCQMLVYAPQ